jgi:5-methylcytosine-specific restriction endonuclease McrA
MAKKVRNPRVPRTRNHETMTESAFWGMIRSALRRRTIMWKPVAAAKLLARRRYKGPNKRRKWEYQCAECKNYFHDKDVAVDHIVPAGTLKCSADLPQFIDNLFCEIDGLQCLCKTCHDAKTLKERKKK